MPQSSSHFSSNPSLQISPMTVSSPLTAMPSFDNSGLDPAKVSLNRLQQLVGALDNTLRLPSTPRAFAVYLLGLCIVFIGAFLHVLVAAQIMQAQFTLSQLREEYSAIEQQNGDIIFQIAYNTNMARLHQRVVDAGYIPVEEREYIFVPSASMAAVSQPSLATEAAIVAATTPAALPQPANMENGPLALWEEFWAMSWRAAFGRQETIGQPSNIATSGATDGAMNLDNAASNVAATTITASPDTASTNTTSPNTVAPNFWSVWWEEASTQGAKVLQDFRGQ